MRRSLAVVMFVAPIVLGGAIAARLVAQAPAPGRVVSTDAGLAVRVIPVEPRDLVPVAQGWGNVRPAETWSAISEVRGAVIWQAPDLETGMLAREGDVLMRIDPADYELAIAQAEADLASLGAERAQLEAEEQNTRRVLELEQARLALSESDAQRTRELVSQGTAPAARGDEAERAVLAARRVVVELQNALALIGPRQDRLEAQRARTEAALARARRDLAHTEITAPFDLRITQAPVERYQVVATGQVLVAGEGLAQAEVVAQVPIAAFQRMLSGIDFDGGILEALDAGRTEAVSVLVEPVSNPGQVWEGRLSRVEPALDPQARTVQAVITVDDPFEGAHPPERIPLIANLQAQVTLTGPTMQGVIAVPASAVHGGVVYLMDSDARLELRPVEIAFRQGDLAVIDSGLEAGAGLITDDIAPAIPGMPLRAVTP
ncbi:efflux RND transporter periplasmic adaptor subunit [Pararhodobacter marinus]|uniref:efflux RND transporter periplasmic adaptor subunit n=1 Tax=Pararhodobacter marinus TaxID=2184063 RepID=UPI00351868E4